MAARLLFSTWLVLLQGSVLVQSQLTLSPEDIQELVDAHNLFRGRVNPPATNIQTVVSTL